MPAWPTAWSLRRRITRRRTAGSSTTRPPAARRTPAATKRIQDRANELLQAGLKGVKRLPYARALKAETTHAYDYVTPYVDGAGDDH